MAVISTNQSRVGNIENITPAGHARPQVPLVPSTSSG